MKRFLALLVSLLLSISVLPAATKPLTAFEAEAIAQKLLKSPTHPQLIGVDGPRSDTELTPDTWTFLFFDEDASQQGRSITVSHGIVTKVQDGYSQLDKFRLASYKQEEVIPASRFKVDSKKALEIIHSDLRLQNVQLSSVLFHLVLDQDKNEPLWTLTLYADDNKGYETNIGVVTIDAERGVVVGTKLDLSEVLNKKPAN